MGVPGHISAEKRLVLGPDQQVMYHETDSYCHLRPEDGSFVEDCRRVEIDLPLSYPFGQGLSDNFVSIEREGDTLRISKTYGSQSDGIVETYQASGSLTLTTPKWTNPPEGERIVDVYGSGYYVRKAGSEDWIEVDGASEEIYLGAGDSIRGGDTPLTMIWLESSIFGEGNRVYVSGGASLVLPKREEPTVLDLVVGRIRSVIKSLKPKAKFEIRTPVCVTSPRGTDYLVDAGEGGSIVLVLEGSVEVSDLQRSKTVLLGAGEVSAATPSMLPSDPSRFDPNVLVEKYGGLFASQQEMDAIVKAIRETVHLALATGMLAILVLRGKKARCW